MRLQNYAKDYITLQKRSYHNIFDMLTIVQDCAEQTRNYWSVRIGLNTHARTAAERWHSALKQRRNASRKLVDSGYEIMEKYFSDIGC